MPRTELMAQLMRLRRLGAASRASGLDMRTVDGLARQAATSDEGLTRREILRRGAIAGAGATVAGKMVLRPSSAMAKPPATQPSIAVVGAGIGGMTAAMTLKDRGFTNITVYEANNRVGGRTYTNKTFWDTGQWTEWGGELIDTGHDVVHALNQRFGFAEIDLTTVQTSGSHDIIYMDGSYYAWDDLVADWYDAGIDAILDAQMKIMPKWPWSYSQNWSNKALALSNMNLYDWIETYIPGGHGSRLGRFFDLAYVLEEGAEAREQSCLCMLSINGFATGLPQDEWWVWGESDERYKIVGGNQQISLAQADYLGSGNIHLGWSLTNLTRSNAGPSTMTFDVGGSSRTVTADRVILAVPVGVLTNIKNHGGFANAGFDARKLGMIDNLLMGAVNKLHVQTTNRFYGQPGVWGNSNGSSFGDGYQQFWDGTWGEPGTRGVVCNYYAGAAARAVNPAKPWSDTSDANNGIAQFVRNDARKFLGQVEPAFPGMTQRATGKATLASWHTSPYQRGAYCYWKPGYVDKYCTYERVSQGQVHFAGEHCSMDYQGYINGAADEGIRAAKEIIKVAA
jgi:monoamine oxidase